MDRKQERCRHGRLLSQVAVDESIKTGISDKLRLQVVKYDFLVRLTVRKLAYLSGSTYDLDIRSDMRLLLDTHYDIELQCCTYSCELKTCIKRSVPCSLVSALCACG